MIFIKKYSIIYIEGDKMKKNIYRCIFLEKNDIITWKLNESEEKFLNYLISINIFPKDKCIIEKVEEEK